jgi:hypothetical protein
LKNVTFPVLEPDGVSLPEGGGPLTGLPESDEQAEKLKPTIRKKQILTNLRI